MYLYRCHICDNQYKTSDDQIAEAPYPVCTFCMENGWKEINNGMDKPEKEVVIPQK